MKNGGIKVHAVKKEEEFEDFSYAVHNHETLPLNVLVDESDHLILANEDYHLRVEKNPVRLSFEKFDETIISRDEKAFGIAWDGDEVCNYKEKNEGEIFTGMGEKTCPLNKAGRQFTHWNTDEFGYHGETDPLYTSTPFYFARNGDNWYGIFLDNTAKSVFNFGASNHRFSFFKAERGQLRYYFFHHKDPAKILEQYCHLTGFTNLPPKWALGYQQCRYSYYPDKELLNVAQNFRERNIPADVIYLDIHYMEKYKVFTWDGERFPNPKSFVDKLHELGFKVVVIIDPGVKIEKGYQVMENGMSRDAYLKYPDGENYIGEAWPGEMYLPDFTKDDSRAWWSEEAKAFVEASGIDGIWNDMNEPAVWGKNVPDLVEFEYDGLKKNHKEGHNVYGMQMARASHDGLVNAKSEQRPFILTRSAFSGIQRYAAVWTGDNVSNDEHIKLGTRLITQLGLAGVPFSGNDIGGFIGEADIPLFRRWIAVGAFSPFFRGHSMINSRDAEPWTFGEEAEEIARNYISLRYRLMPYIYSAFREHEKNGMPLARALFLHYPNDTKVFDGAFQDQFLFGEKILVCPLYSHEYYSKVYLPEGKWYDLFTDKEYEGSSEYVIECPNDKIPVFVKEGAIIPMESLKQSQSEKTDNNLELHLYYSQQDTEFLLYDDDGESRSNEEGVFNEWELRFKGGNSLSVKAVHSNYQNSFKNLKIYFHGFKKDFKVELDNEEIDLKSTDYFMLSKISNFDPFEDNADASKLIKALKYIELPLKADELNVKLFKS